MSSPVKPAAPWAVKFTHEGQMQGLPADKIRQKLVLEGAEPEVIDTLLMAEHVAGSPPDAEVIKPSSPSPQRRSLSTRRFHEMLLVGVPPSSVRQKMAMEGCPMEEINDFFATESEAEAQQGQEP